MRALKLSAVLVLSALIISAVAVLPQRLCFSKGEEYTFYCGTSSKDCREVTVTQNASLTRVALKDVCGEGTTYTQFDLESFLKKTGAQIVFTETLSDSVNYYCTADLPYAVKLYGKTINLHISVRENSVKVATPIIFGGY